MLIVSQIDGERIVYYSTAGLEGGYSTVQISGDYYKFEPDGNGGSYLRVYNTNDLYLKPGLHFSKLQQ